MSRRGEELRLYAGSFRDVGEADGSLAPAVAVEDVFADLIERARRYAHKKCGGRSLTLPDVRAHSGSAVLNDLRGERCEEL